MIILPVQWRTAPIRPVAMPSVMCPAIQDKNGRISSDWLGICHCNACPRALQLHINYETGTGEVHCAAK